MFYFLKQDIFIMLDLLTLRFSENRSKVFPFQIFQNNEFLLCRCVEALCKSHRLQVFCFSQVLHSWKQVGVGSQLNINCFHLKIKLLQKTFFSTSRWNINLKMINLFKRQYLSNLYYILLVLCYLNSNFLIA